MDDDQHLRLALAAGAHFALVRVLDGFRERVNTRSQVAGYHVALLQAIDGPWPDALVLMHFGCPTLEPGRSYLVGACDNRRHNDAWQIRFATLAEGDVQNLLADFHARRTRAIDTGDEA